MDSDRLNRWLTLAANFGVIAGIVFLALELRQNSELMRAQSRATMSHDTINLLTLNVSDSSYLDAINRGLSGEGLTDLEQAQFRRTYNAWIWHWNNLVYQHQIGLYDEAEYSLQLNTIRGDLHRWPGMKKHWCDHSRHNASPALIDAIEGTSEDSFCNL